MPVELGPGRGGAARLHQQQHEPRGDAAPRPDAQDADSNQPYTRLATSLPFDPGQVTPRFDVSGLYVNMPRLVESLQGVPVTSDAAGEAAAPPAGEQIGETTGLALTAAGGGGGSLIDLYRGGIFLQTNLQGTTQLQARARQDELDTSAALQDAIGAAKVATLPRAREGTLFNALGAGDDFSVAVTAAGELFAWGNGDHGKLGLNQADGNYSEPQYVTALAGLDVRYVVVGMEHSLALTNTGDLYVWGRGEGGVLGLGASR